MVEVYYNVKDLIKSLEEWQKHNDGKEEIERIVLNVLLFTNHRVVY